MAYKVECKNLGMNCNWSATASTMAALMAKIAKHAKTVHKMTDKQIKDPSMMKKVKSIIKKA